jgi:hypothetical protein
MNFWTTRIIKHLCLPFRERNPFYECGATRNIRPSCIFFTGYKLQSMNLLSELMPFLSLYRLHILIYKSEILRYIRPPHNFSSQDIITCVWIWNTNSWDIMPFFLRHKTISNPKKYWRLIPPSNYRSLCKRFLLLKITETNGFPTWYQPVCSQ